MASIDQNIAQLLGALGTWNLAVAIYPAVNVVVTACVCMLIVVRRQSLAKAAAASRS